MWDVEIFWCFWGMLKYYISGVDYWDVVIKCLGWDDYGRKKYFVKLY